MQDLNLLKSLVSSIGTEVSNSDIQISRLNSLTKELVSKNVYEKLISDTQESPSSIKRVDNEAAIIDQLEKQRIDLVMGLQRQDYLTEKLTDIIDQNEELFKQVKRFEESKDMIRCSNEVEAEDRINQYVRNIIGTSIDTIDINLFEVFKGIHRVEELVVTVIDDLKSNITKLHSEKFQKELNILIEVLNKTFDEYSLKKSLDDHD